MEGLKFETLLTYYENALAYAKRMKTPDNLKFYSKTKEYWDGYIYSAFRFFQDMKAFCEDYPKMRRDFSEEEKLEFDTKKGFPLCGILDYRGHKIPVYDDDYGQSMFAVINGEEIGGGTYNLYPEPEFEYIMDSYLDLKDL